jgi:hypothetical protein
VTQTPATKKAIMKTLLGLMLTGSLILPAAVAVADSTANPRAWDTILPRERDLDSRWNTRSDIIRPPVGQLYQEAPYGRSDAARIERDLDSRWNTRSDIIRPPVGQP